jgi:hypothetical protein
MTITPPCRLTLFAGDNLLLGLELLRNLLQLLCALVVGHEVSFLQCAVGGAGNGPSVEVEKAVVGRARLLAAHILTRSRRRPKKRKRADAM